MPFDNRGGAIGTDMKIGKIEGQKLVRAASHSLQIFRFVFHLAAGVRVREIVRFAGVHGGYIAPQLRRVAIGIRLQHLLVDCCGCVFGLGRGLRLARFPGKRSAGQGGQRTAKNTHYYAVDGHETPP